MDQQMLKEFFEEQFNETSDFFLYKDKQLLKEGRFREFAEAQIKKVNRVFWSIAYPIFMGLWYGTTELIAYGSDPSWIHLTIGLGCWLILIGSLFFATKQYYSIKSSMNLLLKVIRYNERQPVAE